MKTKSKWNWDLFWLEVVCACVSQSFGYWWGLNVIQTLVITFPALFCGYVQGREDSKGDI